MAYKLALSAALLSEPDLLLLDEPFGPLDPVSADHLWLLLQQYQKIGMGILLSTHQLPAEAVADRYLILEQGYNIGEGSAKELEWSLSLDTAALDALLRAALERHAAQGHAR